MRLRQFILLLPLCLAACGGSDNTLRAPYEGFEWGEVNGADLTLRAQHNENIRLIADSEVPGIVMAREGDACPNTLIRIFDLKNGAIEDVIDVLRTEGGWDASQTCRFEQMKSQRRGVRRYVMVPDGDYKLRIDEAMKTEPVPATCNGWGIGNSGMRWFEIHDDMPGKALFMEIGQEAPLFDEESVEFSDMESDDLSMDELYRMEGVLTIGHEVRSFRAGDGKEYWIVDKTGRLEQMYDSVTVGQKNGRPCRATLKVEYNGKWNDGFAAEYDGVFFVREVVGLEPMQ